MDEFYELSDDYSQWPESYWDWFGLDSQSATYNDLRKAYSKLIKRFRPESHPEHFQRIQNAFETLRDLINSENDADGENRIPRLNPTANALDEEKVNARKQERQQKFVDELFNEYIDKGNLDGARLFLQYVITMTMVANANDTNDSPNGQFAADLEELPYVYLFWVLYAINPPKENDLQLVSTFKYLVIGMKKMEPGDTMTLSGRTLIPWLEREELPYDNPLYEYLLNEAPLPYMPLILNIRWINAHTKEDVATVDVVMKDLETLKKRAMPETPKAWFLINLEAAEHLLWVHSDKAKEEQKKCMDEITKFPEYFDEYEDRLDMLDQIEETVSSMDALPGILPADIAAIQMLNVVSRNMSFTRYRRLLLRLVSDLCDDVLRAFMVFDYLEMHHPIVARRLVPPIQQLFLSRHSEADEPSEEDIEKHYQKMTQIWESYNKEFRSCRLALLKYYLQEQFDPSKVIEFMIDKYISIRDDRNMQKEAEQLDNWLSEFTADDATRLTYYAVMCCELDNMEDFEEE